MFQYRQALARLRQGDTDREIARAGLMGRPKVRELRALAKRESWLAPQAPLLEDEVIVRALGAARRARSTISGVDRFASRFASGQPGHLLTRLLDGICARRGVPSIIRSDNGNEFTGKAMLNRAHLDKSTTINPKL